MNSLMEAEPSTDLTGFYQTAVAAVEQSVQEFSRKWSLADSIYWSPGTKRASIGSAFVIPGICGDGMVPIGFDKHPQAAIRAASLSELNTVPLLRRRFVDPAVKGIMNHVSMQISSLFTDANFHKNRLINCGRGTITKDQLFRGMAAIADCFTPIDRDLVLLLPPIVYHNLADPKTGKLPSWINCPVKLIQTMPETGEPGSRRLTGALMHRFAIAGISRPLSPPDPPDVVSSHVQFNNFVLRAMLSNRTHPILPSESIFSIDAGYGVGVVNSRPCQLFSIAE